MNNFGDIDTIKLTQNLERIFPKSYEEPTPFFWTSGVTSDNSSLETSSDTIICETCMIFMNKKKSWNQNSWFYFNDFTNLIFLIINLSTIKINNYFAGDVLVATIDSTIS